MNFEKVSEIFNSDNVTDLFYKGKSIWIESLDPIDKTAEISLDDDTKININVRELEMDKSTH